MSKCSFTFTINKDEETITLSLEEFEELMTFIKDMVIPQKNCENIFSRRCGKSTFGMECDKFNFKKGKADRSKSEPYMYMKP